MTTWDALEHSLAKCLRMLQEDQYLVIGTSDRYVQFAGLNGGAVRAEAISGRFAAETDSPLSDRDSVALSTLGWHLPDDSDDTPNFFADYAVPVNFTGAASLAITTLRLIFEIESPGLLRYTAGSFDGEYLVFDELGIAREEA